MSEQRYRVAYEAARLLYIRAVKEYIQAKELAASNLGIHENPSNFEVALQLDKIIDEEEGTQREERLVEMRNIALNIMRLFQDYNPILIGSVWRGTSRLGSDIDIIIFTKNISKIQQMLTSYQILERGEVKFKDGVKAYHFILKAKYPVDLVVRHPDDYKETKCDIYGDIKKGINPIELERLLLSNPQRKFIPRKRPR